MILIIEDHSLQLSFNQPDKTYPENSNFFCISLLEFYGKLINYKTFFCKKPLRSPLLFTYIMLYITLDEYNYKTIFIYTIRIFKMKFFNDFIKQLNFSSNPSFILIFKYIYSYIIYFTTITVQ